MAHSLERVQQGLLETTRHAHALMGCQIVEQSGDAFLEAHRDVHSLHPERGPRLAHLRRDVAFLANCSADSERMPVGGSDLPFSNVPRLARSWLPPDHTASTAHP